MALKHLKKPSSALAFVLLAACANGEKWPNLSDRLPDTAERSRVLETSEPANTPRSTDVVPVSEPSAQDLLETIEDAVSKARQQMNTAMASWRAGSDADTRSLWMGAQLAVTRLSQAASRVNTILFSENLKNSDPWQRAQTLKNEVEAVVQEARQDLAERTP